MLKPFSITGIGSLPHRDPEEACRLILRTFDIPFWPQLPKLSFLEWMIPQYAEGMPFIRIDQEEELVYIGRNESDELVRFYEACGDGCRIAMSEDYAHGLHAFLRQIRGRRYPVLKGQVTGPLTFTLGMKDADGRLIYFDEELREVALLLLRAKARWQIDQLKQSADDVIVFIDEPILAAIGSSTYLGVSREETRRLLSETASAIREAGGIPGIHCCGSADWPLVIESGVTVLNFDAYAYFDTLAIYHAELRQFLDRGGYLAWGIVPTTDMIADETPGSLSGILNDGLDRLSRNIPADLLRSRSILTPSCGAGSRTVDEATKILQLLMRLKEEFA